MKTHHRDIIAFLRTHGAENPRLLHHGRHPRIAYRWQGAERTYVVPGTPGDSRRGTANAIADLRRELGPPLPPPEKPKRTIEDLMPQLVAAPLTQPKPEAISTEGTVAHYDRKIRFRMPAIVFEAFGKPESASCRYLGNDSWEIVRTHAPGSAKFRKAVGNSYIYDTSGLKDEPTFGATPAGFSVCDGQILVALKGERRPVAQAKMTAVKPERQPAVTYVAPASLRETEDSLTARLRKTLAEIRALEAQTVYRLVKVKRNDDKHWAWSAPRIE